MSSAEIFFKPFLLKMAKAVWIWFSINDVDLLKGNQKQRLGNVFFQVAAKRLHESIENLRVFVIGVGEELDRDELDMFATSPENVFLAASFDDLEAVESAMTTTTCEGK